ncbi:BTB/POZ domain and ankyrin repeat-containing protein NPR1-like [Diospyros lotus]|uniref:BTB/POZ domain and ankyrin repeat-containing protein NPR1-like n=1 Tax=Diospyros lotus TaxID=55363 RepID=UPI002250E5E5|nr:BTB/POZ domain and ankyrin repeat-containing protein NPR1-like [Diospyros lotus]
MDNRTAFSDSNDTSGGSSSMCCVVHSESLSLEPPPSPELAALRRFSENLESILESSSPESDFADARIAVSGGREIAVHRCILSARSAFFKDAFCGTERGVSLELKQLAKDFDVSFKALVSVLAYLYSGKVRALPEGVCVCVDDECSHEACRPAVDFMVELLYVASTFQISELVSLYKRHLLYILDKVSADDTLVVLSLANICGKACERLLARCIENIARSEVDVITLDRTLPQHIVKQILDLRKELGLDGPETNGFPDKHVKRIHRAIDSDDVELVGMLLKEGHTSLGDAYALHYAVAYCNPKTTTELLDLGIADVNQRNLRGYTLLHVAALRREPQIIASLLTKGAQPTELTSDGRKALQISKRLTRALDYYTPTEKGKATPKDRLCVEILEQAESRDPLLGEASLSLAVAGEELRMRLLDLENRVGIARLLFPLEAKVAMEIARVDGTSEFPLASMNAKNGITGTQRTTVDLTEAPFKIKEEHLNRLQALSKTVQLGKQFFPRCSEVLNEIMDADDLSELASLKNETPEERERKKQRYMELQGVLAQAFHEDNEEIDRPGNIFSPSSSASKKVGKANGKRVFPKNDGTLKIPKRHRLV